MLHFELKSNFVHDGNFWMTRKRIIMVGKPGQSFHCTDTLEQLA